MGGPLHPTPDLVAAQLRAMIRRIAPRDGFECAREIEAEVEGEIEGEVKCPLYIRRDLTGVDLSEPGLERVGVRQRRIGLRQRPMGGAAQNANA